MLRFYSRALSAKRKDQLVSLADDVTNYYRSQARTSTNENPKSYASSVGCLRQETGAFLEWMSRSDDNFYMIDAAVSVVELAGIGLLEKESPMRTRKALFAGLGGLPLGPVIDDLLKAVGVPSGKIASTKLVTFSFLQVLLIHVSHGKKDLLNPFSLALNTGYTMGYFAALCGLRKYLDQRNVPRWLISVILVILVRVASPVLQRTVRFGLKSTIDCLAEQGMSAVFRVFEKKLPDLPIDASIAPSVECLICHDLMHDPVEILGHFCCRECLKNWMSRQSIHPLTGVTISQEMVTESVLMSHIVYKYKKYWLKEAGENQENK